MAVSPGQLSHVIRLTSTYHDGESYFSASGSSVQAAGSFQHVKETFANGATDVELTMDIDISECTAFMMRADGDLTVETNDGATPDDIFALSSTSHVFWCIGFGAFSTVELPLSDNVVSFFVTNNSGTTRTLEILCLTDPTL